MTVDLTGWLFLGFVCLMMPWMALRSVGRIRAAGGVPRRGQYLFSVFYIQGLTVFLALAAARFNGVRLFPPPSPSARDLLLAVAFLVPAVGTLPWRWSWKPEGDKRRSLWILPNSTRDLGWWVVVCLVAGICEEIVYRGVAVGLLTRLLGSWWAAVAVCVVVFALAHYVQGWRAVATIVVMSVAAHLIVRATGDLYTMMVVHVVYDLLAGVILLRLARRDGLVAAA